MNRIVVCVMAVSLAISASGQDDSPPLEHPSAFTDAAAAHFAELALDCIHREYPNKIAHVMNSPSDVKPPREMTPVFFGCYDWHSAVHGHWLLVRLCRTEPSGPFVAKARAALDKNFTSENVAAELAYLRAKGRGTFERPYGLAWLLQLAAELHEWNDPQAKRWSEILEPLEQEAAKRFSEWLPKLSHPVRTGEHSQTAFAMGLVLDWARCRGNKKLVNLLVERALDFSQRDRGANLAFEPDGEAFLSPIVAEADLMRRILTPKAFASWLRAFLPEIESDDPSAWLPPAVASDRTDGKLVHLDGLNLSRAWMLEGIAAGLPAGDPLATRLRHASVEHRHAGLEAIAQQQYEGGHWLGSFAVYLVTQRGL